MYSKYLYAQDCGNVASFASNILSISLDRSENVIFEVAKISINPNVSFGTLEVAKNRSSNVLFRDSILLLSS